MHIITDTERKTLAEAAEILFRIFSEERGNERGTEATRNTAYQAACKIERLIGPASIFAIARSPHHRGIEVAETKINVKA